MIKRTLVVGGVFLAIVIVAWVASSTEAGSLYDMFSEKTSVKTYISEPVNLSGVETINLGELKNNLKSALASRMTINFAVTEAKEEADIIIGCNVTEFLWTDKDPVDNISGIGPILMDSMSNEHYSRMQAVFTVTDAKTGKELWNDTIKATITDPVMTSEESVPRVNERLVKVFLRDCFSKKHDRV